MIIFKVMDRTAKNSLCCSERMILFSTKKLKCSHWLFLRLHNVYCANNGVYTLYTGIWYTGTVVFDA